jgi:hypothetical protein
MTWWARSPRYAVEHGYDALIFTGDRDQLQLINPHVHVCAPQRGVSELQIFDADAVQQKYGLTPAQIVDYKALAGDPSDNIPGVPGVGEKTAVKLLQQFGSVENLLANLEQVENEKLRETLRQYADQIRQSRMLATILDNAPLPIDTIPRFELTQSACRRCTACWKSTSSAPSSSDCPRWWSGSAARPRRWSRSTRRCCPRVMRNPDETTLARLLEGDAPVGVRFVGALNRLRDAMLHGVALAVAPDRAVWLELGGSLFLPEPLMRLLNDPQRKRAVWDIKTECLLLRGAGSGGASCRF